MKRLFAMLFVIFYAAAAFSATNGDASLFFSSESIGGAFQLIPQDKRDIAAAEWASNLQSDGKISVEGIYKVCAAAGWNAPQAAAGRNASGGNSCSLFLQRLLDGALKFYEVCGKDKGKSGGAEFCVEDFQGRLDNSGVKVQALHARGLMEEWALVKHGREIKCDMRESEIRSALISDKFIKCAGTDNKTFYEFRFNGINERNNDTILNGVMTGVCKWIHGAEYFGEKHSGNIFTPRYCSVRQAACPALSKSLERFGYSAQWSMNTFNPAKNPRLGAAPKPGEGTIQSGNVMPADFPDVCQIFLNPKTNAANANLRTIPGVDNRIFFDGIKVRAVADAGEIIRRYVAVALKRNNKSLSSFRCNDGYTEYIMDGPAARSNPFAELKDTFSKHHVITCFARIDGAVEQPIDFLFDDLSAPFAATARGGLAGANCTAGGGDYDGKNCWLDKDRCAALDKELKSRDSKSLGAAWNDKIDACLLFDSEYVRNRDRFVALGVNMGKASIACVGALAAAPITGGSAVPACAATVIMLAGMTIEENAAAAMEEWSADIIRESRACQNIAPTAASACAEKAIAGHLLRASYARPDLRSRAITIVDEQVARLVALLSEDAQAKIFANENEDAWLAAVRYFDGQLSAADKRTMLNRNIGVYVQLAGAAVLVIDTALNLTGAKAAFREAKMWRTIYKNNYNQLYDLLADGKMDGLSRFKTLAQFKAALGNDMSALAAFSEWSTNILTAPAPVGATGAATAGNALQGANNALMGANTAAALQPTPVPASGYAELFGVNVYHGSVLKKVNDSSISWGTPVIILHANPPQTPPTTTANKAADILTYGDFITLPEPGESATLTTTSTSDTAGPTIDENRIRIAYDRFAPKNQSLEDFKKMFRDNADFEAKVRQWHDMQYPGSPFENSPLYSTFDANTATLTQQFEQTAKGHFRVFLRQMDDIGQRRISEEEHKRLADLADWYYRDNINTLKRDTIMNVKNNINGEAAERVWEERLKMYSDIINNNPTILKDILNFDNLSETERAMLANGIVMKTSDAMNLQGSIPVSLVVDKQTILNGLSAEDRAKYADAIASGVPEEAIIIGNNYYDPTSRRIAIRSNVPLDRTSFFKSLLHEMEHALAYNVPDKTMIGAQNQNIAWKTYVGPDNPSYKFTLDEQSSYYIENIAEKLAEELAKKQLQAPAAVSK